MSDEQFAFLVGVVCGAVIGGFIAARLVAFLIAHYVIRQGKSIDDLARRKFDQAMRRKGK